jgi:hypothetical protein
MARCQVQARSIGGARVPSLQDLLRQAIQAGDDRSVRQVRGHHLPERLLADLARQTHEYAVANATADAADGWLVFADGIEPWWRSLAGTDFARLYQLSGDVVKVLTQQGLAYRAHPRDKRLHVRPR